MAAGPAPARQVLPKHEEYCCCKTITSAQKTDWASLFRSRGTIKDGMRSPGEICEDLRIMRRVLDQLSSASSDATVLCASCATGPPWRFARGCMSDNKKLAQQRACRNSRKSRRRQSPARWSRCRSPARTQARTRRLGWKFIQDANFLARRAQAPTRRIAGNPAFPADCRHSAPGALVQWRKSSQCPTTQEQTCSSKRRAKTR
jgi:hypothetical protein